MDKFPHLLFRAQEVKRQASRMRHLLLTSVTLACFGILRLDPASAGSTRDLLEKPDFSGTWALDLKASDSLEPLMTQIGANFIERTFASWANLTATFQQSGDVLTVATRGPGGFALNETLNPDGFSRPTNLQLLGATSLSAKTVWSKDNKLIATHQIKTKQGKEGQLVIKRYLTNGGKTEVVAYTLRLDGAPDETSARQFWQKLA